MVKPAVRCQTPGPGWFREAKFRPGSQLRLVHPVGAVLGAPASVELKRSRFNLKTRVSSFEVDQIVCYINKPRTIHYPKCFFEIKRPDVFILLTTEVKTGEAIWADHRCSEMLQSSSELRYKSFLFNTCSPGSALTITA